MGKDSRVAMNSRLTIWSAIAAAGSVGAVLLIITSGVSAWIGLALLCTAVVLGFLDGFKGWSERS